MNDRTPTEPTLLPCPFCGGMPRKFNCVEGDGFVSGTFVRCDECGIDINDEYESGAIEAWNRRAASPAAPGAEVEPVAFNINETVLVRLNDHGREIIKKDDAKWGELYPRLRGHSTLPEEDADGWSKWQLWRLMTKFGPHMLAGAPNPFDITIRIPPPPTTAAIRAIAGEGEAEGWRTMETAPRDGTFILAVVAPNTTRFLEHHVGRVFVIRHQGKTTRDYDLGWSVYPGYGGEIDATFSHWRPLPAPPSAQGGGDGE